MGLFYKKTDKSLDKNYYEGKKIHTTMSPTSKASSVADRTDDVMFGLLSDEQKNMLANWDEEMRQEWLNSMNSYANEIVKK